MNGILSSPVLKPRLVNIPFASCFLINLHFLLPHIAHFENFIVLPLLVFETTGLMFSVYSFYTSNNNMTLFYIW